MSVLPYLLSLFCIHAHVCFGSCRLSFPSHPLFKEQLLGCPWIWIQSSILRYLTWWLVTLVAVSIMSCCSNTSHTAGSDTCWSSWQDECLFVGRVCQLIVAISSDAGRSAVAVFGLVMNMYWQQASSRGSVWSGIYMDIHSAWGRLAGRWEWRSRAG